MNIDSSKIKALIDVYGKSKGYPEKSYIPKFCEDFELNYVQWFSYSTGKQKAGIKILYILINIFPDLNLNWLLKDNFNMFLSENNLQESQKSSQKTIENIELLKKLDSIEESLNKAKKEILKVKDDLK